MKRRNFILLLTQATAGVYVGSTVLTSCSFKSENLDNIIGKNIAELSNYTVEYTGNISCLSLANFSSAINASKAFLFVQNNKVIGYSIKFTNSNQLDKIPASTTAKADFDNAFGTRKVWKDDLVYKSTTIPKKFANLNTPFFYSEYLEEAKNNVF